MSYREPPRHARPPAPLKRALRADGHGRSITSPTAVHRLARWIPVLWWICYRTIEPTPHWALADDTKLIGATVAVGLIVVVETWISVRQRSRQTAPRAVTPPA